MMQPGIKSPISSSQPSQYFRREWIEATQFFSHSEEELLEAMVKRIRATSDPVVIFDLDSTLYQVEKRSFQILKEWVLHPNSSSFSVEKTALNGLTLERVGYSIQDTFNQIGLDSSSHAMAYESVRKFWWERFFTNEYLRWDEPYPQARRWVSLAQSAGAQIVYLTGRDEPNMRLGTVKNLVRDQFPWGGDQIHLMMKAAPEISDAIHKKTAALQIQKLGCVVASFENEPHNLMALQEVFPQAMHVFVETLCSEHPTLPGRDLYRLSLQFE